jgi:DNA modification methylase
MNWAKIIIGDSRKMVELEDESVDLIITSPPYWHIKDYGNSYQIGYNQTLHEYLKDLFIVWKECFRVLKAGRRLCINIGDQFTRAVVYGKYKIIPIHAEIILQCEKIGFDYMGAIIWQKKTTMNTTGGANVMGSYPYPPNGMIEIDYEYILIFKKPGKIKDISKERRDKSVLKKEEWKEYFYGHWKFAGQRQLNHEAMFPQELPKRLIKMYSFVDDIVLDPFLGSGTTIKAALELNRNAIGYEVNINFLEIIKQKIGINKNLLSKLYSPKIEILIRNNELVKKVIDSVSLEYEPVIKDLKPILDPKKLNFKKGTLYKVVEILSEDTIKLETGTNVKFLGVIIIDKKRTLDYLKEYVLKKRVIIKLDEDPILGENTISAYVYLENKIFINAYLIKSGLGKADANKEYKLKSKFLKLEKEIGYV